MVVVMIRTAWLCLALAIIPFSASAQIGGCREAARVIAPLTTIPFSGHIPAVLMYCAATTIAAFLLIRLLEKVMARRSRWLAFAVSAFRPLVFFVPVPALWLAVAIFGTPFYQFPCGW